MLPQCFSSSWSADNKCIGVPRAEESRQLNLGGLATPRGKPICGKRQEVSKYPCGAPTSKRTHSAFFRFIYWSWRGLMNDQGSCRLSDLTMSNPRANWFNTWENNFERQLQEQASQHGCSCPLTWNLFGVSTSSPQVNQAQKPRERKSWTPWTTKNTVTRIVLLKVHRSTFPTKSQWQHRRRPPTPENFPKAFQNATEPSTPEDFCTRNLTLTFILSWGENDLDLTTTWPRLERND